jgi:predicted nucleic acid-binding protein
LVIVLDVSAVIEYLLGTTRGDAVRDRIAERGQSFHAPHLLDVEVAHVLRRYSLAGDLPNERGREALRDLVDLART